MNSSSISRRNQLIISENKQKLGHNEAQLTHPSNTFSIVDICCFGCLSGNYSPVSLRRNYMTAIELFGGDPIPNSRSGPSWLKPISWSHPQSPVQTQAHSPSETRRLEGMCLREKPLLLFLWVCHSHLIIIRGMMQSLRMKLADLERKTESWWEPWMSLNVGNFQNVSVPWAYTDLPTQDIYYLYHQVRGRILPPFFRKLGAQIN